MLTPASIDGWMDARNAAAPPSAAFEHLSFNVFCVGAFVRLRTHTHSTHRTHITTGAQCAIAHPQPPRRADFYCVDCGYSASISDARMPFAVTIATTTATFGRMVCLAFLASLRNHCRNMVQMCGAMRRDARKRHERRWSGAASSRRSGVDGERAAHTTAPFHAHVYFVHIYRRRCRERKRERSQHILARSLDRSRSHTRARARERARTHTQTMCPY